MRQKNVFISISWRRAIPAVAGIILLTLYTQQEAEAATTFGFSSTGSTSYPITKSGDTNIETGAPSIVVNVIQAANKITVSSPITIQSFVLYFQATYAHKLKFAVYPDNGGTPVGQTLVKQTGEYSVSGTGWVTVTLATADYINLSAGTYWLCFLGDTTAGTVRRAGNTTDYYASQTYASGYPATFPAATSEAQGQYSFYAADVQVRGYAKATKATLSQNSATINSMSFYSHATGNFRLAIYSDSSGPSSKLWESNSTAATASAWNTVQISAGTPSGLTLNSGTYWLAWQWDSENSGPSYTAGSSGDGNYISQAYGAFSSSWSGGTSSSEKWSIYATYTTTSDFFQLFCKLGTVYLIQREQRPAFPAAGLPPTPRRKSRVFSAVKVLKFSNLRRKRPLRLSGFALLR